MLLRDFLFGHRLQDSNLRRPPYREELCFAHYTITTNLCHAVSRLYLPLILLFVHVAHLIRLYTHYSILIFQCFVREVTLNQVPKQETSLYHQCFGTHWCLLRLTFYSTLPRATIRYWIQRVDSNHRPPGYEPGKLPTALPWNIELGCPNSVCLLQQTQTNISTGSFRSQVKMSAINCIGFSVS